MDELEERVRDSLLNRAGRTPDRPDLLIRVRERSARLRRRRRLAVAIPLAAALAVLGVVVRPLVFGAGQTQTVLPAGVSPTSGPQTVPPTAATDTNPAPGPTSAADSPWTYVAATTPTLPVLPLHLGSEAAGRVGPPEITVRDSAVQAAYPAADDVADADITLVATPRTPAFGTPAGPVTQNAVTVRGHQATLRTVAITPAAELILFWQESPGTWIQLRTDDTYTASEVIAVATGLRASRLTAPLPVTFTTVPVGLPVVTVDAEQVLFRADSGHGVQQIAVRLVDTGTSTGRAVPVGPRTGHLTHSGNQTSLIVDFPDRDVTVRIEATGTGTEFEASLIRFATGITPR